MKTHTNKVIIKSASVTQDISVNQPSSYHNHAHQHRSWLNRLIITTIGLGFATSLRAQNTSFPYNATYPYGLNAIPTNQSDAATSIRNKWSAWKTKYVTTSGTANSSSQSRVQGGADVYDFSWTVSEGQSYGLLIAVYMGEQDLFNRFWGYVKSKSNGNGLMWWLIDGSGNYVSSRGGQNNATDADVYNAAALSFAHKKWGSGGSVNYLNEAKTLINNIMEYNVDDDGGIEGSTATYAMTAGDWNKSSPINCLTSYYATAFFRVFKEVSGDNRWDNVINKCTDITKKSANSSTGLLPESCKTDGTTLNNGQYYFGYNAFRAPFLFALDHSWYGNTNSRDIASKVGTFYSNTSYNATAAKADRELNGSVRGNFESPTFLACAASSLMARTDKTVAQNYYNKLVARTDTGYYAQAWQIIVQLYCSGNMPNLWTLGGTSSSTTGTNVLKNGSFEQDGASTQNPASWSSYSPNSNRDVDANYTESSGGNQAGSYHLTHYKSSAYQVYTYQIVTGLTNGTYTASAWVKGGTSKNHTLRAKNYGGSELSVAVPGSWASYQKITISNISVTNGQCEIGFYSSGGAGEAVYFDDVQLTKN